MVFFETPRASAARRIDFTREPGLSAPPSIDWIVLWTIWSTSVSVRLASFISDPTDHAFDACLSAHSWLETILLADRNTRLEVKSYNDEYFDRFYNLSAATLIRQLSEAATDVGSYWLTAWTNAGKPPLPH